MEMQENMTDIEKDCMAVTENLVDAGEFVDEGSARTSLKTYFLETGLDPKNPNVIFGQIFGLNMFTEFLAKINKYNEGTSDDSMRIYGIRIYNGMTTRPYLQAPRNVKPLPDAILMPVLKNGKDLYTIHDLVDPVIILTGGRPCPNECGTSFF